MQIDPKKLTPEQKDRLDNYKHQKQVETLLSDVADMVQSLYQLTDDNTKVDALKVKSFGSLLVKMKEDLSKLASKEDKEYPDYAKPVVEAVEKLEKAFKKINFSPNITVDAPPVNVSSPSVNVDLKGVEKEVKKIPKAFDEAIAKIPQPVIPEQIDRWDEVLEALSGIEVAARLKPQMPTTLKVTNPDGSDIGGGGGATGTELQAYTLVQDDENATYEYYGYVKSDGSWCIKRVTISTNYSEFVIGASAYATAWTNRASQTYDDYWDVF